jgi:replicative DNA helicase
MTDSVSEEAGGLADLKKGRRRKVSGVVNTDRLPPHSPEAEQGVLGCILLSPNDCIAQCIERIKAGPEVFYDLRHQMIYKQLVAMYDQLVPIDVITLQQCLKDSKMLDQIGGIAYLNALQDAVPTSANVSYYADIVLEKHQLRRMISACTNAVGRIYDHEGEVDVLLDEVERDILSLRREDNSGQKPILELVRSGISLIQEQFERQGAISGIGTGFSDLDRMTDGLHGGEMIVIAGRPSLGKTSLVMNIAEHVTLNLNLPVGVFSLEMSADQLIKRSICSLARVNLRMIRDGFLSERDFPKLTSASGRLANAPLYLDDTPGLSILQLRAKARRMWQQHGIRLFVVDYLQLLHSNAPRAQDNRQQEISDISGGLKALSKELNVPVLVASQLNRELEKTKGRKPLLSHLRESGAIEQDADVVGLLYKPGDTDVEQDDESDGIPVNLFIAKQRNGPTGDVHLTFLRPYTRFESAARVADEDVPDTDKHRKPYSD